MTIWMLPGMLVFGILLAIPIVIFDVILHRFASRKSIRVALAIAVPPMIVAWVMISWADVIASDERAPESLIEIVTSSLPLTAFAVLLSILIALSLERAYRK